MDLPHIARALQNVQKESTAAAIGALKHYYRPLSEKELNELQSFNAERRSQLDAGLKVGEVPKDMEALSHRPVTVIHPLMVAQCVLSASRQSMLTADLQRHLYRLVMPSALIRHPLLVKECAALLNVALQLPFRYNKTCINAAKSVLRCVALILFKPEDATQGAAAVLYKNLVGAVYSSFSTPLTMKSLSADEVSRVMTPVAPKVKDCTLKDAQRLWWTLLSHIVDVLSVHYQESAQHNVMGSESSVALNTKSTRLPFSKSKEVRQLSLLAGMCHRLNPAAADEVIQALSPTDQVQLAALSSPIHILPSALLTTIKNSPGVVRRCCGSLSAHGCGLQANCLWVKHDEASDLIGTCLYNMGLTTTTSESFLDYWTVLLSIRTPIAATPACLKSVLEEKGGKDVVEQLLSPFVNNPRAITPALAQEVGPLYSQWIRLLLSADDTESWCKTVIDAVLAASVSLLVNRCRTSVEKAVVSQAAIAMFSPCTKEERTRNIAMEVSESRKDELVRFLQRELSSPSAESVTVGLRLTVTWFLDGSNAMLVDSYQAALRNAKKNDEIRRALLLHTPSLLQREHTALASILVPFLMTELIQPLLEDCEEVEVVRPDAFLSLYFLCGSGADAAVKADKLGKLSGLLSGADVLSGLLIEKSASDAAAALGLSFSRLPEGSESNCSAHRVFAVAVALSEEGQHAALVQLLTHQSQWLQREVKRYLEIRLQSAGESTLTLLQALWDTAMERVFGLGSMSVSSTKPSILSSSAKAVVEVLGGLLLAHCTAPQTNVSAEVMGRLFASLIWCLGHDYVQGKDAKFYTLMDYMRGQPSGSLTAVKLSPLYQLLGAAYKGSMVTPPARAVRILNHLLDELVSATSPAYAITAASRAVVLFFALVSQEESKRGGRAAEDAPTTPSSPSAAAMALDEDGSTSATSNLVAECFGLFSKRVITAVAALKQRDARDLALASGSVELEMDWIQESLREQNLIKVYPDRPPKGVSADDFMDMKKKDAIALEKAREQLKAEVDKHRARVQTETRSMVAPLLTVRLLGATPEVDSTGVAVLYPFLFYQLCGGEEGDENRKKEEKDKVKGMSATLWHLFMDAVRGMLMLAPFAPYTEIITATAVRLYHQKFLEKEDVKQISALALALRRCITQMLPAPLFVVLMPFCRVAFKAGRGSAALTTTIPMATQHQLLGMLLQSVGQPHLPQPTEAMELFALILKNFPGQYKSVLQGVQTLMGLIPARHLKTIEVGLFQSGEGVRDVTGASFPRFSHFITLRRALILACVFTTDLNSSHNVLSGAREIIEDERYQFELQPSDFDHLLYFLRCYGGDKQNALLILATLRKIFEMPTSDEAQQVAWIARICEIGGLASVVALRSLSSALHPKAAVSAIDFLCTTTEQGASNVESLLREVLDAGRVVLKDMALNQLREIAPGLNTRLARPPKDAVAVHKEQYLATATVWLTIISSRLQETELLKNIIEQQSRTLNNSQSLMVHRCVCESMIEITKNEEVSKMKELDEFMVKCIKQTIQSGSYVKKKAHAWGLVGVISGLGLPALRRYDLINIIQTAAKEKQTEKTGAMVLVEVLCDILGRRFEPYALALSEIMLEGVADQDQHVSACADDAVQMMMRKCLSGIGLRQLIPHLIEILSSDQAKRRVAPLNFIGHVASCSPKQLAATLPRVMKHILPCLFEVNNMVSAAAYSALRRVAGVVSNPEIQEQVENILNAMRSPSTETENALDALLYTRFINVVDPASLALVIPVVSRGLNGQMRQTRSKAAQIVATMVTLVSDPQSLTPYADELIMLLEGSAQDPEPEARTTSAKALSALCFAIGEDLVKRVTTWCFDVLRKASSGTIEKAGAGQVFVELVNRCGMSLMDEHFATVEKGMTDENTGVREGFLYIMVYAPSTFDQNYFQEFLPVAFPWVLNGLSHYSDRVREVALTAGDSIIGLYGTRNLDLVLGPLLDGMDSEVTTLRHSSLQLASKLLLHLAAHIRKKTRMQNALEERQQQLQEGEEANAGEEALNPLEDDAAEGGVLTVEAARDVEKRGVSLLSALEEMLGEQNFVRLFAAIYCGSHEHSLNVRTDCSQAWQACVASIRAAVKKIFYGLSDLLIRLGSSDNLDCVDCAVKAIEFTSRIQETIDMFIETFCERYKSVDALLSQANSDDDEAEANEDEKQKKPLTPEEIHSIRVKRGCLTCLAAVVSLAESKKLISMGGQLVGCILPGMQHNDREVQAAASDLFGKVTKVVGPRLIEDAVEAQLRTSVRGVVEVVKVKPEVALQIVFRYFKSQSSFTDHDVELLSEILDVDDEEIEDFLIETPNMECMIAMLLTCLQSGLEGASEVMQKLIEISGESGRLIILGLLIKASQVPRTRRAAVLGMEAYGLATDVEEDDEGIRIVLQTVIASLSDEDDITRTEAVRIIPNLITDLESRIIAETLDDDEAKDMTVSKRTGGRYLAQYLDVVYDTMSSTASSFLQGGVETCFGVLGEGEPRLFDALMALYQRGLDYGSADQKVKAVECIQDIMRFAPKAVSANAANTVAGRCSKALFTRNEGSVVLALVNLCHQLLQYPANGKEKMVESTMALALFNATLCDSGEARLVALQVAIQLLQRSEKYAELILGNVMSKKSSVDTPLFRTVLCRFVSVIMRYSHFTKAYIQIPKLMALIRPIWEGSETPAQASAGGVAIGALCMSESIKEPELQEIKELVLRMISTPGSASLAGYAAVYSLIIAAGARTDKNFLDVSAGALASAAKFGATNTFSTLWLLRAAAAVAGTGCISEENFHVEAYLPVLRRIAAKDDVMMSTAQFFIDKVSEAYPKSASLLEAFPCGYTAACMNGFDADLDDEYVAGDFQ